MKKILLVTLDFWPRVGGMANYYFNLCKRLDTGEIFVLTNRMSRGESGIKNHDLGKDFNFKIYRKKLLWKFIWPQWLGMFWHIWRVIKKEKIEMIWVGEVLPTGTAVYFLTKILKLPYIVSCHGNDLLQAKKNPRKRKLAERILAGAKLVTVNSKFTGKIVKDFEVDEGNVKVIYPGINIKNKELRINNQEDLLKKYDLYNKRILFSIGRLVARKGFDKVIRALPKVWKEIPSLIYVVAGTGSEELGLKKLARQITNIKLQVPGKSQIPNFKYEHKVVFLGEISDEEKWAWLSACDVFITTAQESDDDVEGFGIVYLEAALAGKAVIAGNCGGAMEAVVNGETGILVNAENVDEISGAIVKLFKDERLAKAMGEKGKLRVEEEFRWERSVKKFKEAMEDI